MNRVLWIPNNINENITINPQVVNDNIAKGFVQTNKGYSCIDPRLYNSARNQYITLDRPPTDRSVRTKDVYSSKLNNYGVLNNNYSAISDGAITYYAGKDRSDAPFRPIYPTNEVLTVMFENPDGNVVPEYYMKPQSEFMNPFQKVNMNKFMSDTQYQRESITGGYKELLNSRVNI